MARKAVATKEKPFDQAEVERYFGWASRITDYYPAGDPQLAKLKLTKDFSPTNSDWLVVGPERLVLVKDENDKNMRTFVRDGDWQVREVGAFKPEQDPYSNEWPSDRRIVEYKRAEKNGPTP